MAESPISSPEAPLLGELSSDSETERLYFAAAFLFSATIYEDQSMVFEVLTADSKPVPGPCMVGSLTGAVSS